MVRGWSVRGPVPPCCFCFVFLYYAFRCPTFSEVSRFALKLSKVRGGESKFVHTSCMCDEPLMNYRSLSGPPGRRHPSKSPKTNHEYLEKTRKDEPQRKYQRLGVHTLSLVIGMSYVVCREVRFSACPSIAVNGCATNCPSAGAQKRDCLS